MKTVFLSVVLLAAAGLANCVQRRPPQMTPAAGAPCRTPTAVQWFAPDDPKDRERLDRWCAGVGPAVISAGDLQNTAASSLRDITFVSWNVHVGSGDLLRFVDDLRGGRLITQRPSRELVLLLQEAVREDAQVPSLSEGVGGAHRIGTPHGNPSNIDDLARRLGMSVIYIPSMRNGRRPGDPPSDRGSAILSTLPLKNLRAVELPFERQRRVAVLADLSLLEGNLVSVGVVHLDAVGSPKRLWIFGTAGLRLLEAESLATVLPTGPLVLGADLNTWHGRTEPAAKLLSRLFATTRVVVEKPNARRRSLDYLFVRAGERETAHYAVIRDEYGSDHHPIVGWVE